MHTQNAERYVLNAAARDENSPKGLLDCTDYADVLRFLEEAKPGAATPLVRLLRLANRLGVGEILVKDESSRWGLNAFKTLGVSYATHRLRKEGAITKTSALCCATDGNHGRAVAQAARRAGLRAFIYLHSLTSQARIEAIQGEGSEVVVVEGTYDDAVKQAAEDARQHGWTVISDTSWPGYEVVPRYIMAGYTILLEEAAKQWGASIPDVVFVQAGVGGLLWAVANWLFHRFGSRRPCLICCEPTGAACILRSVQARELTILPGSPDTVMAGLSCGSPSYAAWPMIASLVDAFVAIPDEEAEQAMRWLAKPESPDAKIVAGESGACGLGTLVAVLRDAHLRPVREAAGLGPKSKVLIINTEGATDPRSYAQIVGTVSAVPESAADPSADMV
jgi:diaminopropionate ammonia-lyase